MCKRLILLLSTVSICLFCFSCKSDLDAYSAVEDSSYQDLMNELDQYCYINGGETKGPFWNKLKNIALCDAFGAAVGSYCGPVGATFGAIVSSLEYLFQVLIEMSLTSSSTMTVELNRFYNQTIDLYDGSFEMNRYDSLGLVHNQAIIDILLAHPNVRNMNSSRICRMVYDYIYPEGSEEEIPIRSTDVAFYQSLASISTFSGLFSAMEEEYPELQDELNVIRVYAQNISNLQDDQLGYFTHGFRDIVLDSSIEEDSKNIILSTIAVAGSSVLLWNEEEIFGIYDNNEDI